MQFILLIGLGIALWQLWQRVDRLERRLADAEARTGGDFATPTVQPVAAEPVEADRQPASTVMPAASVSSVPKVSGFQRAIAHVSGAKGAASPPPSPKPAPARREKASGWAINFEDLFGRQLPIWAGGITLAVAGFFLVLYSIELGLLTPAVRVFLGFAFGAALIQVAFAADRWKRWVDDPRVPQALAGAGLATLYACFYLAGNSYGLIGGGAAFLGLAAVTAGAVWLSFRFGLPCAVIGLVGGFAAPMLVSSDQANLPLLSIYLALVSAGLTLTGRRQDRSWLGIAALGGALLWGMLMLTSQEFSFADRIFVGGYLIAIGVVLPAGLGEVPFARWLRAGAGVLAAFQMAVLVENGGFALLTWGLYALLSAALAWFAWNNRSLRNACALTAAVGIWLLGFWPSPHDWEFALVGAGFALIFGLVPLAHLQNDDASTADIAQIAFVPFGIAVAAIWHFGGLFEGLDAILGCIALALAAIPAFATWKLGEGRDWRIPLTEASAALTACFAIAQFLPERWGALAYAAAAIAAALALPGRVAAARVFGGAAALFALWPVLTWWDAGLDAIVATPFYEDGLPRVADVLRYVLPTVIAGAVVAWRQQAIGHRFMVRAIGAFSALGAVIIAHVLFRSQLFPLADYVQFVALGYAERTLWEALLLAAALAAMAMRSRIPAMGIGASALAHFVWFSLVLHNPMWGEQAVGPVPVANLLLAAFAIAIGAILVLRRLSPAGRRMGFDIAIMVILPLLALSLLRQAFSGSLLDAMPVGQAEELLRSLSGILLAAGYLLWGARKTDRVWRIGSLVLMLMAVGKVFVLDASDLEGLARIASFLALGFSLIGIGWFYARQLRAGPEMEAESAGAV